MPTQRMITATFAGQSAEFVQAQFERWRVEAEPAELHQFCQRVRQNVLSLVIVYYTEWIDRWSSGYHVPGPNQVDGNRYSATTFTPDAAREYAQSIVTSAAEHRFFVSRLQEAADGWGGVGEPYIVVVIREVLGALAEDSEIEQAAQTLPTWLAELTSSGSGVPHRG
jgi:hypothetical protein